jgi:DNA-binding transcriptional MerR regulator
VSRVPDRSHLSIGEVLSLLREEFPDVTISKIRFLESQGLVDPERTPSGYRKFYEHDVERLRWILRQQRENFLPLKIIRGRLTEQGEDGEPGDDGEAEAESVERAEAEQPVRPPVEAEGLRLRTEAVAGLAPAGPGRADRRGSELAAAYAAPAEARVLGRVIGGEDAAATTSASATAAKDAEDAGPVGRPAATARLSSRAEGGPKPIVTGAGPGREPAFRPGPAAQLALGEDSETYSAEELAHAAGGTLEIVSELQQFGLISPRVLVGGSPYFDQAALDVTRAASAFARHGVEARHLRAWRNAADREASLFEQVILPLLRQRNPDARQQAAATLAELAALGGDLRKALIDQALRQIR